MADTINPNVKPAATVPLSFDDLYRQYEKNIFNLIYRTIGDYEDAVDLTSQTFLHALRAFDLFRGDAKAYTWLYRIAVNLCKNYFRKKDSDAKYRFFSLDDTTKDDGETMDRDIEDNTNEPERVVENAELQVLLQTAINNLSPDLRTVILLRDVQGLSYQEISDAVGCSLEAVKSRIFRARGQLRKELSPYLHIDEE
jgi:RNA polymerase sigma-70 factor (ECF subfamily)